MNRCRLLVLLVLLVLSAVALNAQQPVGAVAAHTEVRSGEFAASGAGACARDRWHGQAGS